MVWECYEFLNGIWVWHTQLIGPPLKLKKFLQDKKKPNSTFKLKLIAVKNGSPHPELKEFEFTTNEKEDFSFSKEGF